MPVTFNNPFQDLINAAEFVNGGALDCEIFFHPDMQEEDGSVPFGSTTFPDDGSCPQIAINADMKIKDSLEILAHELAHVIVGVEHDHDAVYDDTFNAIRITYDELANMAGDKCTPR